MTRTDSAHRHRQSRRHEAPRPLTAPQLRDLALAYVARYATSRAKLGRYLERKLAERGWDEPDPPDIDALIARLADLHYVDDEAYATQRAGALLRRGYGARRIAETLRHDGIAEQDRAAAAALIAQNDWDAARDFARRKRIGPFATCIADRDQRQKQLSAFLRAGHTYAIARQFVDADPGEEPIDERV